jgi:two-component system NarL family sensor kinase
LKDSGSCLQHLSARLLEAQEEERRQFATEVHDSFSASLSAIKFRIESMQKENGTTFGDLENLKSQVQGLIEESWRIQMALCPSILGDLGIVAAPKWFTREFQKTYSHMEVTNEIDAEEHGIPAHVKTPIFRIAQEAFNNAAKHSKAKTVKLSLVKKGSFLQLEIQDNGIGWANYQIMR